MKRALLYISDMIVGKVPDAMQEEMCAAELRRMDKHPPKTQAEKAFQKFLITWHDDQNRKAKQ